MLPGVRIGKGAHLKKVIVDENYCVAPGSEYVSEDGEIKVIGEEA